MAIHRLTQVRKQPSWHCYKSLWDSSESDPIDPNNNDYNELDLRSIDEFITARKALVPDLNWPAFKERLEEMNHKPANGASRTGDIVTILDGRLGYMAINTNEHDRLPGWHGGPTISESYVPLMFAMPGDSFVDTDGNIITAPPELQAGFSSGKARSDVQTTDGNLRNWHLAPILSEIIDRFRDK